MEPRQLQFKDFAEVRAEVDQLHRGGYEKLGQWDLAQVCDHLTYFVQGSLDGHAFQVPWLIKVLFGRLMLRRILKQGRMNVGGPTPQKPLPPAGGDEAAAVARFHQVLERLQAHQGELHPSPFFGHLTPQQWRDLHRIHCAHHLGFLVPKAEAGKRDYPVAVQNVEAQTTGVIRRRARSQELAAVIPQACGEVWEFFRASGLPRPGRHVALYLDGEINLECGVEVAAPFAGNDRVVCSHIPAGLVATAAHFGPYHCLHEAHAAIRTWCADHGRTLAGPSWEVYGHWDDDPAKLRTDVYYLLQPESTPAG